MNECYFCGGKVKKEKANIIRYWGDEVIALNDVPALVCTQCGEQYYSAKTSHKIDQKIAQVLQKRHSLDTINVPVVQFS